MVRFLCSQRSVVGKPLGIDFYDVRYRTVEVEGSFYENTVYTRPYMHMVGKGVLPLSWVSMLATPSPNWNHLPPPVASYHLNPLQIAVLIPPPLPAPYIIMLTFLANLRFNTHTPHSSADLVHLCTKQRSCYPSHFRLCSHNIFSRISVEIEISLGQFDYDQLIKRLTGKKRWVLNIKQLLLVSGPSGKSRYVLHSSRWFNELDSSVFCYSVVLMKLFVQIPVAHFVRFVKRNVNLTGNAILCLQ